MSRSTAQTIVIVLAILAALMFISVANTELSYVNDHPNAYGPAAIIARGGIAGAILSAAVAVLAWSFRREK